MRGTPETNWNDLEAAAKERAGNWQHDQFFAWRRGRNLEDAARWMIWYTAKKVSGLPDKRDEAEIKKRLRPFSQGTDPDVVFKKHRHRVIGYVTGFSLRVYRADGSLTPAFEEFCRINQEHSDRKYAATLANYRKVMWNVKGLAEGWERQVWSWFDAAGWVRYAWNSDEKGGRPPREHILEALESLGLIERKPTPLSSQEPGQIYLKAYRALLRHQR